MTEQSTMAVSTETIYHICHLNELACADMQHSNLESAARRLVSALQLMRRRTTQTAQATNADAAEQTSGTTSPPCSRIKGVHFFAPHPLNPQQEDCSRSSITEEVKTESILFSNPFSIEIEPQEQQQQMIPSAALLLLDLQLLSFVLIYNMALVSQKLGNIAAANYKQAIVETTNSKSANISGKQQQAGQGQSDRAAQFKARQHAHLQKAVALYERAQTLVPQSPLCESTRSKQAETSTNHSSGRTTTSIMDPTTTLMERSSWHQVAIAANMAQVYESMGVAENASLYYQHAFGYLVVLNKESVVEMLSVDEQQQQTVDGSGDIDMEFGEEFDALYKMLLSKVGLCHAAPKA